MARTVLGILLLVAGVAAYVAVRGARHRSPSQPVPPAAVVAVPLLLLGVLLPLTSSFHVVEAGNIGVISCLGKIKGTRNPGVGVTAPWCNVVSLPTRTRLYVMVRRAGEGQTTGDDSLGIEATDNVRLSADVTVQYRLRPDRAEAVYRKIGSDYEEIVRNISRAVIRDAAARFTAEEVLGARRSEVAMRAKELLEPRLAVEGFLLEDVLFREIRPADDTFTKAIAEKAAARQRAEAKEFELQAAKRDAEIAVTRAQGEAEANNKRSASLTSPVLCQQWIEALKEAKPSVVNTGGPCGGGGGTGGGTIVSVAPTGR